MWNSFENTISEDETVTNGFCRSSIFKISSDNLITEAPLIQANLQNKRIVVAINKNLILIENENNTSCSFLCFESHIDQLILSQSGILIICALSDGDICGIHIKGFPIFKLNIKNDDIITKGRSFIGIHHENNSYYLTCSNGFIYRLSNIDEYLLQNNLHTSIQENETYQFDETIQENVKLDCLRETSSLNGITANTLIKINTNDEFLLIGATKLYLKFQTNSDDIKIVLAENFDGFKSIFNLENYVLGLTNEGHLVEICPFTKIYFQHFTYDDDYLIDNLIVMENNNESIEILLLTKQNDLGLKKIKLIDFPSFKCIQELEVSQHAWLVNQPKNSVNLYYLSGEKHNEINYPQEIVMKLVSETQPEQKLKKLLQKGYFEEAEIFGKQFNFSLQPIYETKAKNVLQEIEKISENSIKLLELKFNELLSILKLIENKNFFIGIRNIDISSRKIMFQYLNELLDHLKDSEYQSDILEINEQQLRLETLDIIDPYECNLEWQKFIQHPNIMTIVTNFFKTDMLIASLIWKRHSACIIPNLDETSIIKLLQKIPSETEPFNIVQWLRHFIPSVLQIYPKVMPILIEWILQKIRSLQFSNYWPEIGLEFSTKIQQIFDDINFLHSDLNRQYESSMEKLKNLVNALQDLSVLKKSYNLILTLDYYIKDSIDDTSLHILQRLQTNILKSFIKDFLYPIYREKGQSPLNAIIKYIKFLVVNRNGLTTWLERATLLIELLHNEEEKLKCALMVLRTAPVPWPQTLLPLINLRNSGHPLGTEINTLYELQIISIMRVKYGWPADAIDNNMKLVFRIVTFDLPEMFEDIKNLTKSDNQLRLIAIFYCCYELTRNGKIDKAIQFFSELDDKEKIECSEKIVNIISNIVNDNIDSTNTNDMFYEFLKIISQYSSENDKKHIKKLLKNQKLYEKFELKLSEDHLITESERYDFLHKGIKKFVNNITNTLHNKGNMKFIWDEIIFLTDALNLENLVGIIELAKLINNIHLTSALAYYSIEILECNKLNCDLFIELAILLVYQQILIHWEENEDISDSLAYLLSYKLIVKSLKIKKIYEVKNLLKWIEIGKNLYDLDIIENKFKNIKSINENISKSFEQNSNGGIINARSKRVSISIFDQITTSKDDYQHDPLIDNSSVLRCVSFTILLVLIEIQPKEEIFLKFSKYLTDDIKHSVEEISKKFYTSLEHLVKSKQHDSWYTIAQYLLKDQEKENSNKILTKNFVSVQLRKMFRHLLTQKDVNFTVIFSMLICDSSPKNLLQNVWQELKNDQQKVNFLYLSEIYFTYTNDKLNVSKSRESRLKYYYYNELCKRDSTLSKKTDIDLISFKQLIKELKSKSIDIKLLSKLSIDFEWDYESLLISQIITILHNQELNFELKCDPFGKESVLVKTTVEEIRTLCQPFITEVKNIELLAKNLLNFYNKINYYFYELYLCVIEILKYINSLPKEMELHASILIFLKHKMLTKRKNRPGHTEVEAWLKFQTEIGGGVLPKISKYRLPFIPIVEQPLKDILDCEISVDCCESWFPLIKFHTSLGQNITQLDIIKHQDYFCMSAVKKAVTEFSQKNDSDEYHLQPINNALLQSILRLVQHVTDKSKAFQILYFVANSAPDGADQVEAAYECYKYAIKNETELVSIDSSKICVKKIERKYPILKIQLLLHIYDLVDEKLLKLVETPIELIKALYYHECLLKKPHPDINKIANEIAILHNLDFHILQLKLLQNLLSYNSSTDIQDLEETFYEDLNISDNQKGELNSEFVLRAHYILSNWNSDKALSFLISHIFPVEGSVNTGTQLQLCECFVQLIDDTNANSTYIDIVNQSQYVTFKCVYNLKHLGYNFTIDKFTDYDKLSILKKIWQNHSTNSLAIEVIADICIGFNIHIPKIWNGVLQQMVNLNMLKHLNALVDILSCKMDLLHIDGLAKAWEHVLRIPFKCANSTRSFDQEEILCKSLFRIQGCPLVNKINLMDIVEDCIRLNRPHMAAVLIGYSSDKRKRDKIKMLLIPYKNDNMKKDILELEESGILRSILNYVLKEIELN